MDNRRSFLKRISLLISGNLFAPVIYSNFKPSEYLQGIKLRSTSQIIDSGLLSGYVNDFNRLDDEIYKQSFPNSMALDFLQNNIPLFECPDKEIEKTYYFRWWAFRKHLRHTEDGWVITEFLPEMGHAGKHNTISCPAGHQFREGRWLHSQKFLDDYAVFWFRKGGNIRSYSFWVADSVFEYSKVTGDFSLARKLLPDMVENYMEWEKSRLDPNGLYWQIDVRDGMEVSISGSGYRATINSYQYGDAIAIAKIAEISGLYDLAGRFRQKAAGIRHLLNKYLWDDTSAFYKVGIRTTEQDPMPAGILSWRVNNDAELTQKALPSSSHSADEEGLNALKNNQDPASSGDTSVSRMTLFPRKGEAEWVQYDFEKPVDVNSLQVYWAQDENHTLPREWRAFYRRDNDWHPVPARVRNRVGANSFISLPMDQITTTGLRLEVVCQGTIPVIENHGLHLTDVRELHGYTPWYFERLAEDRMAVAWQQLMDEDGFYAPFGPTTAEQRHRGFKVSYIGHPCQWNGPSWPFSTAITLTALANLLNSKPQSYITKADYLKVLRNYALSHRIINDGQKKCWIDENLNPFTGDWISRTMLQRWGQKPVERGKDYLHSSFCDLIISGLIGVRPQPDSRVVVNPLVPDDSWDWFCLDRVPYHDRMLTIIWDKEGNRYGRGKGLTIMADGEVIASSRELRRLDVNLPG